MFSSLFHIFILALPLIFLLYYIKGDIILLLYSLLYSSSVILDSEESKKATVVLAMFINFIYEYLIYIYIF